MRFHLGAICETLTIVKQLTAAKIQSFLSDLSSFWWSEEKEQQYIFLDVKIHPLEDFCLKCRITKKD